MARLANVATLSFLGQRAGQAVTAQSLAQPATNQFSVVFSGSQSNYVDFTGPYARATNLVSGLGNSFTIECIFRNTDLVPGDYYNADGEGGFTGHAYRYLCLTAAQPTCPTTVTNTISIYSEYGALNGYSCLHGYIATNDSDPNLRILGEVANNPRLLTNEWHHGALTYTNSILTLFEDGNLIDSTVYPFNFLGANFTVLVGAGLPEAANSGCRPVEHLNGSVAEVRISNIARYTAPYLISDACFDVDANTLQYWKMNEGSSNVCYDSSGHSNNLILRYSNNSNNGGVWTNPAWATDTHVCGNPKSAVLNQPLVFNSNTVFKASDGHYVERIITNILGTYSDTFKDLGTISP